MTPMTAFPHERRVQRYAFVALALAVAAALLLARLAEARLLGVTLPPGVGALVVIAGAAVGAVAVMKRRAGIALAAASVLVLGVLGTGGREFVDHLLGVAFGATLLAFAELVHTAKRYERAHRVVETEHSPEASLNRVTDETLKTLASRLGIAAALVLVGIGGVFMLHAVGPRQWQAAVETTSPLGVAIAALAILGAISLYILIRGASFRGEPTEVAPDVAE